MAINVKVQVVSDVDLKKFTQVLIRESQKLTKNMQDPQFLEQVGNSVVTMLQGRIFEQHPIGHFMEPRTEFEVVSKAGYLEIDVKGMPEGQVQGEPAKNAVTDGANLWNFFEYGGNTGDVEGQRIAFEKMGGGTKGKTVFAYSRHGTAVTKYKGEVQMIVASMRKQIEEYVKEVAALGVEQYVENMLQKATNGRFKASPADRLSNFLNGNKLSNTFLKKNKISFKFDSIGRIMVMQGGKRISKAKAVKIRRG